MNAMPAGMNRRRFGFGNTVKPQPAPNFGGTPGMNPMAMRQPFGSPPSGMFNTGSGAIQQRQQQPGMQIPEAGMQAPGMVERVAGLEQPIGQQASQARPRMQIPENQGMDDRKRQMLAMILGGANNGIR